VRLLLDTHAFLWLLDDAPTKLSRKALEACQDEQNELFLSTATVWELQIKHQLGKLRLKRSLQQVIEQQLALDNVRMLPIDLAHIYALGDLPRHHRDPFDRMLIAQARVEGAEVVTHDPLFAQYPVTIQW
jgi:PIN domain nuclease of toxin-antitoxin system